MDKPNDTQPKISVITPSYNQARFLVQTIESVLDQKYPNLEYMILDGGSTDGSIEIIRRYEKHLSFWESTPDNGQSHAINKGFRRATGELVAWINSDDYYLPEAFAVVAEAFRTASTGNRPPGFFFGTGIRVDREGSLIGEFWPHKPVFDYAALVYGFDYILQPATFIRRDSLLAVGLLDETLRYCMDYDLWIRLAGEYSAIPVDHPVAASREYRETKSLSGGMERCAEIAQVIVRHTGLPATPGVLYYTIITLQGLTRDDRAGSLFSEDFQRALALLHTENLFSLSLFSEKEFGFPEKNAGPDPFSEMAAVVAGRKGYLTGLEEQMEELTALLEESEADRKARLEVIRDLERRYRHLASRMPVRVLRKLGIISSEPPPETQTDREQ